jgi:hypothetical protein
MIIGKYPYGIDKVASEKLPKERTISVLSGDLIKTVLRSRSHKELKF